MAHSDEGELAVSFPKNSPQVAAANEGTIALGWVNPLPLGSTEGRRAATTASPKPVMPAMCSWCPG